MLFCGAMGKHSKKKKARHETPARSAPSQLQTLLPNPWFPWGMPAQPQSAVACPPGPGLAAAAACDESESGSDSSTSVYLSDRENARRGKSVQNSGSKDVGLTRRYVYWGTGPNGLTRGWKVFLLEKSFADFSFSRLCNESDEMIDQLCYIAFNFHPHTKMTDLHCTTKKALVHKSVSEYARRGSRLQRVTTDLGNVDALCKEFGWKIEWEQPPLRRRGGTQRAPARGDTPAASGSESLAERQSRDPGQLTIPQAWVGILKRQGLLAVSDSSMPKAIRDKSASTEQDAESESSTTSSSSSSSLSESEERRRKRRQRRKGRKQRKHARKHRALCDDTPQGSAARGGVLPAVREHGGRKPAAACATPEKGEGGSKPADDGATAGAAARDGVSPAVPQHGAPKPGADEGAPEGASPQAEGSERRRRALENLDFAIASSDQVRVEGVAAQDHEPEGGGAGDGAAALPEGGPKTDDNGAADDAGAAGGNATYQYYHYYCHYYD